VAPVHAHSRLLLHENNKCHREVVSSSQRAEINSIGPGVVSGVNYILATLDMRRYQFKAKFSKPKMSRTPMFRELCSCES